MKKNLKLHKGIYHYKNGVKIPGAPTGVYGTLTGVSGNLDTCKISKEERKKGINIEELIRS